MEEDQVVEQQDDLERMISHMCAEALKRGKDWLSAKMVDTSKESRAHEAPALANLPDEVGATEWSSPRSQKASKGQKSEGKPARMTAKRPRVAVRSTEEDTAPKPGSSIARAPAEGEHISAIIQECFKSLAPLLLRGNGVVTEGIAPLDRQASTHAAAREHHSSGDPLAAWSATTKVPDTTLNMGNAPKSYTRPSLGAPSMTTRAAGLATAIPMTVKERICRK
ncbi:hypothetical protein NDU88_010366 [Pleurodeles waltl]|uniref:Uncharacterized protein n=1 Tax=Pleurodeles waltl TaxID=8319 RepID=A0AAV7RZ38_PLEWA|nr:hypothetical protein NDU88_010366 [Pleurodeles waltl]